MKPKTILFVGGYTFNPNIGGVERVTHVLTLALKEKGYEIIYLSLSHKGDDTNLAAPQYYFADTDIYSEKNVFFYNNFLQEKHVNVIVNQYANLSTSYLFLNINPDNRQRIRVISVCHNKPLADNFFHKYTILPLPNIKFSVHVIIKMIYRIGLFPVWWWWRNRNQGNEFKRLYHFGLARSDKFVVLVQSYVEEILNVIGQNVNIENFAVIPNPNSYSSNEKQSYEKKKQILYVGRFDPPQKRPDILLKVWHRIYKQHPDWELIFLGSGSWEMEKKMKCYTARHHLDRVFFMGNQEPLPYYHNASILALPSIYEGFPMVITEAMTNRVVPVLFDSFGAASEIVTPNETGILVKSFRTKEFANKLSKLMHDETERQRMSYNAVKYVQKYDIQYIIQDWINLIEN